MLQGCLLQAMAAPDPDAVSPQEQNTKSSNSGYVEHFHTYRA